MVAVQKITLVVEKWSDQMAVELSEIDADCDVSWYRSEVLAGSLNAMGVYTGSRRVGSVLTRIDDEEFVMVAGAGRANFDLIASVVPYLEQMAVTCGCSSVRLHTRRKGLIIKARRQGFNVSEIVMRKAVS